jgi:hypothetical protein
VKIEFEEYFNLSKRIPNHIHKYELNIWSSFLNMSGTFWNRINTFRTLMFEYNIATLMTSIWITEGNESILQIHPRVQKNFVIGKSSLADYLCQYKSNSNYCHFHLLNIKCKCCCLVFNILRHRKWFSASYYLRVIFFKFFFTIHHCWELKHIQVVLFFCNTNWTQGLVQALNYLSYIPVQSSCYKKRYPRESEHSKDLTH